MEELYASSALDSTAELNPDIEIDASIYSLDQ